MAGGEGPGICTGAGLKIWLFEFAATLAIGAV
jgi:hypothetical protein